jgi:hypothetical protein
MVSQWDSLLRSLIWTDLSSLPKANRRFWAGAGSTGCSEYFRIAFFKRRSRHTKALSCSTIRLLDCYFGYHELNVQMLSARARAYVVRSIDGKVREEAIDTRCSLGELRFAAPETPPSILPADEGNASPQRTKNRGDRS